jgi:hypothetical protein
MQSVVQRSEQLWRLPGTSVVTASFVA